MKKGLSEKAKAYVDSLEANLTPDGFSREDDAVMNELDRLWYAMNEAEIKEAGIAVALIVAKYHK